jgi:Penicillin binding protein transpeptidase domain
VIASRWNDLDIPIPMGSLVKPFTALAYGEHHAFVYPTHVCRGKATGCWLPRGHGQVNLTTAIAYSCNSYFRMLAGLTSAKEVSNLAVRFDLESPEASASAPALVGIGKAWRISPIKMAHAYLQLVAQRDQVGIHEVVEGMALSARQGTGAAIDRALPFRDALVKTGTAPCSHRKRAPGDGFALVLWPMTQARILLLVRVHGVPGANAAISAGAILRRVAGE